MVENHRLCRLCVVRQESGLTVPGLINAQSIMEIVFQLFDVLRFGSDASY